MIVKTSELTGSALEWAVAKCEGAITADGYFLIDQMRRPHPALYSTDWSQGGPIIEREMISLLMAGWDELDSALPIWEATSYSSREIIDGPTPLTAAMRCYVASKLGDEVEIPNQLTEV